MSTVYQPIRMGSHAFCSEELGATFQRAMTIIAHYFIGTSMEVYIDDLDIMSTNFFSRLPNSKQAFLRI